MLKLIIGVKGTGKTKTLIDMVNQATAASEGSVVCIERGVKLRYDIKYRTRLINTNDYLIFDAQSLYGFVAGVFASNHDVTDLYIDSALKICNDDVASFEKFLLQADELAEKRSVNIIMTSSIPVETASDIVKKYID